jgi:hypothetical protein
LALKLARGDAELLTIEPRARRARRSINPTTRLLAAVAP